MRAIINHRLRPQVRTVLRMSTGGPLFLVRVVFRRRRAAVRRSRSLPRLGPPLPLAPAAASSAVVCRPRRGGRRAPSRSPRAPARRRRPCSSCQGSGVRPVRTAAGGGARPASAGRCWQGRRRAAPGAAPGPRTRGVRGPGLAARLARDATGSAGRGGAAAAGGPSRSARRGGGGGGSGGMASSSPLRICGQSKRICGWCASISRMASASIAARPTRTPGGDRNQ